MKFLILTIAAAAVLAIAQPSGVTQGVTQIMARVADNQSQALEQRKNWVYHQKQRLRFLRGNGKVAREENREYTVAPDVRGLKKDLTYFDGKYETGGKYVSYDKPGYTYKEMDIDGELIDEMSNEMTNDNSRDGIGKNLFPLTAEEQEK